MSRLGPLALLLILGSAAAASACCFFKCCFKSGPVAPDGESVRPGPRQFTLTSVRITQVDTQAPDSGNNIPNDIDSTRDLQVVVETDFDPTSANPELTLTDDGPRGATAVPAVPAKKPQKKYKPFKILEKPKPVIAAAPASPAPAPPPAKVWQSFYSIPSSDLMAAHNYSLVATAGSATSPTVTFHTAR